MITVSREGKGTHSTAGHHRKGYHGHICCPESSQRTGGARARCSPMCGTLKEVVGDSRDSRGYMHRAWLCKRCLCFTPSKLNRMEKAKQSAAGMSSRGENKDATSCPHQRKCPTGLCGTRREQSSKEMHSASTSWYKWSAARSRAEHPWDEPLAQLGMVFKNLPLYKGCVGRCKPGLCLNPWGAGNTHKWGLPAPKKTFGLQDSSHMSSLHL